MLKRDRVLTASTVVAITAALFGPARRVDRRRAGSASTPGRTKGSREDDHAEIDCCWPSSLLDASLSFIASTRGQVVHFKTLAFEPEHRRRRRAIHPESLAGLSANGSSHFVFK